MSHDVLPPLARGVLALYEHQLADHRFGDLDAATLRARADEVVAQAARVESARATLGAAEGALDAAREALARAAERALAYARIHGADDPAVGAAVAELEAGAPVLAREKPRRGRRPRRVAGPDELPFEAESGERPTLNAASA